MYSIKNRKHSWAYALDQQFSCTCQPGCHKVKEVHFGGMTVQFLLLSRSRGEKEKASNVQVQSKVTGKVVENIRQLPPVLLMDED